MSTPRDVAVFVGSLRLQSLTRKIARAAAEFAPASLRLEIVEIGNLPLYNQDLEGPVNIVADKSGRVTQALGAENEKVLRMRFGIGTPAEQAAQVAMPRTPEAWTALRQRVKAADAVLFVTPETNRSVPGVLKNAIDVASRPYGQSAWGGKPGAVISVSSSATGGFGANHHLRQSLVALNVPTMPQPEAYLGTADTLLDASGQLSDERTRESLRKFMLAFAVWIDANGRR